MLFWLRVVYYFAYFFIMILFMLTAVIGAKSKLAWILYAIGAVLQWLSLNGNQKVANMNGTDMTIDWLVYFGLLLVTAILMIIRYKKSYALNEKDKEEKSEGCTIKKV